MKDRKHFRTSSFYGAVFLLAKGMELVTVDRVTDPRRAGFVFVDTDERESLLRSFSSGKQDEPEALVDARRLTAAIRSLKEKLYEESF